MILARDDYREWLNQQAPKEHEIRGHRMVVLSPGVDGGYECARSGRGLDLIDIECGSVAAIPTALAGNSAGAYNIVEFDDVFTCYQNWYAVYFGDVKIWLP